MSTSVKPARELIGVALAAGYRDRPRDSRSLSAHYAIPEERMRRALEMAETSERPEVVLVQRSDPATEVWATAFFSSVWSEGYRRLANPYGRVHRDFHYQVLFVALATLAQAGCTQIRVENPMSGMPWRVDAYVCLREVWNSVRKHVSNVTILIDEGALRQRTVRHVEDKPDLYKYAEHRPVGVAPHVFEGLSMQAIHVETASLALQMDRRLDLPASFL